MSMTKQQTFHCEFSITKSLSAVRLIMMVWMALWGLFAAELTAAELQRFEVAEAKARSGAIVVKGSAALVHTAQLLPLDAYGKLGDTNQHVEAVFNLLDKVLEAAQASRETVVKLNLYVARDDVTAGVRAEINRRFGQNLPAVAFVRGNLPQKGALLALDAVAVSSSNSDKIESVQLLGIHPVPGGSHYTILPAGRKAYVSGLAGEGTTQAATESVLKQLWDTLSFLEAKPEQIAQFKVFVNPMTEQQVVVDAIKQRFPQGPAPVIHLVEWMTASPVEIEMIVALPKAEGLPVVEYLTPPGAKASPVFSRVVRVNGGREVYLSGLYGEQNTMGEAQLATIFLEMKRLVEAAGSDFRHMVKATYYVASDVTNRRLTTIRTEQFDPNRAPAASKAAVLGTGLTGRMVTLDMITVTKE